MPVSLSPRRRGKGNSIVAAVLQKGCDKWIYCYQKNADYLLSADFDDVELFGLHFRRSVPLKRQHLTFDDGSGTSFDLTAEFLSPPFDYADGAFPTPSWMAANRYHRAWRVDGSLCIAGKKYSVCCTGDSDHSWGQRHNLEFAKHVFKMWSLQTADGRLAISVLYQGVDEDDHQIPLGFVMMDGVQASAATIDTRARYDANGVQYDITLELRDTLGRKIKASMPKMHSYIGHGAHERFWGFEGVGDFIVEGVGRVPGLSSYFWPARVKPSDLQAGKYA